MADKHNYETLTSFPIHGNTVLSISLRDDGRKFAAFTTFDRDSEGELVITRVPFSPEAAARIFETVKDMAEAHEAKKAEILSKVGQGKW